MGNSLKNRRYIDSLLVLEPAVPIQQKILTTLRISCLFGYVLTSIIQFLSSLKHNNQQNQIFFKQNTTIFHLCSVTTKDMNSCGFGVLMLLAAFGGLCECTTRFKSVKCTVFNPEGIKLNYCEVKAVSRTVSFLNLGVTLSKKIVAPCYVNSNILIFTLTLSYN